MGSRVQIPLLTLGLEFAEQPGNWCDSRPSNAHRLEKTIPPSLSTVGVAGAEMRPPMAE
jgi:hypothetical protein